MAIVIGRPDSDLNFDIITYEDELEELKSLSKEEAIAMSVQSGSGHERLFNAIGRSGYRGVKKTESGNWVARIWYGFLYVHIMKECSCFCIYIYYLL